MIGVDGGCACCALATVDSSSMANDALKYCFRSRERRRCMVDGVLAEDETKEI